MGVGKGIEMKRLLPDDDAKVPLKIWKKVSDQGDYEMTGNITIPLREVLDGTILSIEASVGRKFMGRRVNQITSIFIRLKDSRVIMLSAIDGSSGYIYCDYFEGCDGDLTI